MARIRTIKPEFWADEKIGPLSSTDRLVFLGLISLADDCGRLLDNVKQIDAAIFPYTDDTARGALAVLESLGRIARGQTSSGQRVIQVCNWHHQKIERPNLGGALPPIVGYEDEHTEYHKRKRLPTWLRLSVFERDKHKCQCCGKENLRSSKRDRYDSGPDLGEVDHKTEAIDGGEPVLENLTLLCLPCNRKKAGEERRRRNIERAENDRQRVAESSPTSRRYVTDVSTPRSTTYDLRPTTNDLSPPRKRSGKKSAPERAFPYFGADDRARALAAFRKLGDYNAGRIINAVGFAYRPATDPEHIPHEYVSLGVEDYCGLVSRGRSAPFASPEDCAKRLLVLASNCHRHETGGDPVARVDANMLAIHGHAQKAAA